MLSAQENVTKPVENKPEVKAPVDSKKTDDKQNAKIDTKTEPKVISAPVIRTYTDSLNNLYQFSYKEDFAEILSHNNISSKGGSYIAWSSAENCRRLVYDSKSNLEYIEDWVIKGTLKDSYLESVKKFSRSANDTVIEQLIYNKEKPSSVITKLDANQRVLERREFIIKNYTPETDLYNFDWNKNRKVEYIYEYKYDGEGRVVSETITHFSYDYKYSDYSSSKSVRKSLYSYRRKDCPPDTQFFENGVLRMKTIYRDENNYTKTVFFDGNASVTVEYKKGKKVLEIFSIDGQESFRQSYE